MTPTIVVDASALVAVLVDDGAEGSWAVERIAGAHLAAPAILPFEVDNVLRRLSRVGKASDEIAALAHSDLGDLAVQLWPHAALAGRIWELRANLSAYDAAYVAVAEALDAPLVTLDRAFTRAPGVSCEVRCR